MSQDLDFWVGEWDARWEAGTGTNVVTSELDGTVVLERFDGRPGTTLRGISVSVFDRAAERWRQTWVDSEGGYLDFVGGVGDDGVFELRHEKRSNDGSVVPFRMRFVDVTAEAFTWLWERGEPDGAWSVEWRIDYTRAQ
jgi:hypothetical protein